VDFFHEHHDGLFHLEHSIEEDHNLLLIGLVLNL